MRVKIEVGQIWEFDHDGDFFPICQVVLGRYAYYSHPDYGIMSFTDIDDEGFTDLEEGWEVNPSNTHVTNTTPVTEENPKPLNLQSFFSAVAEGNCPCNIPRSQCNYHR